MKIGPKYKIARRLGSRVFPKTQTTKFSISGSPKLKKRPRSLSEYGSQLLEKQKIRYTYGLKERQMANYAGQIMKRRGENPSTRLYRALESRLDNIVYRLGLAPSRLAARQLVTHGHIFVGGRRLSVPSAKVAVGATVQIRPQSRGLLVFANLAEAGKKHTPPPWLTFDGEKGEGRLVADPIWGEVESDLNFPAILEFYSRA